MYSAQSLELSGRYTSHDDPDRLNTAITMSLTVIGSQMQGTGISTKVNQSFNLALTKK